MEVEYSLNENGEPERMKMEMDDMSAEVRYSKDDYTGE